MTADELLALPPEEVVAALAPLTEKERKALAPQVKALPSGGYDPDAPPHRWLLAVGCAGSAKQVANAVWLTPLRHGAEPLVARVLADRAPAWLPALPAAFAENVRVEGWRLVRTLVREGLLDPPDSDWYVTAIVYSAAGWRDDGRTPLGVLREDPGLLDEHLWTLLRTEGAGPLLAQYDSSAESASWTRGADERRPEATWRHAFVTLSTEGALDRDRLLDATLAAFLRDWRPVELPWFVTLHDALAPADDELAARQETYARLLAVAYGPAVKLAQAVFTRLVDAGRVDADLLLRATPAVLQRPEKGVVLAHLKLLARLAKARPDCTAAVADAARVAFEHEHADVRDRAAALVPEGAPVVVTAPVAEPAARAAPLPVGPVADADELAEVFARLVEDASDAVEVERAYEGVVRLARHRPAGGGEALAKRAEELLGGSYADRWDGRLARFNLCGIVLVWLRGVRPGQTLSPRTDIFRKPLPDTSPAVLVAERAREVAQAVHRRGFRLLSLPVTSDGTVPADVLSERLREIPRLTAPLPVDAVVAALRVPPASYGDVVAAGTSRSGRAVREALAALAAYAPVWERVALAVAEDRHAGTFPAATWRDLTPAPGDGPLARLLDRRDPASTFEEDVNEGEYLPAFEQAAAQWPLLLPHYPDLLAAHAHGRLVRGLRRTRSGSGELLDGIARGTTPTGPATCSALALGLAQQEGAPRTRAVDALVDLAAAGLLDGAELGRQAAAHLTDGVVVGTRVAASLREAARAGGAPAAAVTDALCALLPVLPGRRDAAAFVEVLAEVAAANGRRVTLPEELAALARGRSSSALAAACRRVPV